MCDSAVEMLLFDDPVDDLEATKGYWVRQVCPYPGMRSDYLDPNRMTDV